ncbi:hypothetical protein TYRP_005616 [Tyrophagus putrescentiae]|nr:hypothetical protein TYRP_005616 [Tyrophagus putrescentiae]
MSDRSDLDISDFDPLLIGANNSEDTGISLTNDSVLNTINMAAQTPQAVTNVTNNYSNINVSTLYDGENYVVWNMEVEANLLDLGFKKTGVSTIDPKKNEFLSTDLADDLPNSNKAKSMLIRSVSNGKKHILAGADSLYNMLQAVKDDFALDCAQVQNRQFERIYSIQFSGKFADYFAKLDQEVARLRCAGGVCPDSQLVSIAALAIRRHSKVWKYVTDAGYSYSVLKNKLLLEDEPEDQAKDLPADASANKVTEDETAQLKKRLEEAEKQLASLNLAKGTGMYGRDPPYHTLHEFGTLATVWQHPVQRGDHSKFGRPGVNRFEVLTEVEDDYQVPAPHTPERPRTPPAPPTPERPRTPPAPRYPRRDRQQTERLISTMDPSKKSYEERIPQGDGNQDTPERPRQREETVGAPEVDNPPVFSEPRGEEAVDRHMPQGSSLLDRQIEDIRRGRDYFLEEAQKGIWPVLPMLTTTVWKLVLNNRLDAVPGQAALEYLRGGPYQVGHGAVVAAGRTVVEVLANVGRPAAVSGKLRGAALCGAAQRRVAVHLNLQKGINSMKSRSKKPSPDSYLFLEKDAIRPVDQLLDVDHLLAQTADGGDVVDEEGEDDHRLDHQLAVLRLRHRVEHLLRLQGKLQLARGHLLRQLVHQNAALNGDARALEKQI